MRRIWSVFLFAAWLFCALASAQGEQLTLMTETGPEGSITYPAAQDKALSGVINTHLGVDDALILLRSGADITGTGNVYLFEKDGISYASLRFTQEGKIRFGRYGQVTATLLLDLDSKQPADRSAIFGDLQALGAFLDEYVEYQILPALNTYLDASELLPVPMDEMYLSPDGLMVHYPADRFSFFSGNSGSVEIKYYEMDASLREALICAAAAPFAPDAETAGIVLKNASEGKLCGVSGISLEDRLHEVLARFGTLTDPDYIAGGEVYEVEEPSLRGVQLITVRGAQEDETACLTGIRSRRANLHGLMTGVTKREECHRALGTPESSVLLDAHAAENYRVAEGCVDSYPAGEYVLELYYDTADVLFAAQVTGR